MVAITCAGPIPAIDDANREPQEDRRWPAVARALARLHAAGRRSVRIVDVHCGAGALLLRAVRHARRLGFVAIEGRGIDADVSAARDAARALTDPAIGLDFTAGDARDALDEERLFPADLVLCAASATRADPLAVLARHAGRTVIGASRPRGTAMRALGAATDRIAGPVAGQAMARRAA